MTGLELRLKRVAADVKAKDVAAAMGVTTSYVSRIEGRRIVTQDMWDRYVSALDTCITKSTSREVA